jgi:tetratricopeptide (TPR) repeat protein
MTTLRFFLTLFLALLLIACGSPEERAAGHIAKAEELIEADDLVKAKLEAQNAAQIQPRNAEARMLLATIAEKEENYRKAIGHLLVAVDADKKLVEPRVRLGNYYFLGRAVEQAREQADAAMELDPDNAEVRLLNARVKFLLEDREAALAETEAALASDPTLVDALMFKAALAGEREDWDEAFAVVDEGIAAASKEDSQPLRQLRIQLLQRTGRRDEIEPALLSLAEDFPDDVNYKYALAQWYVQQDRSEKAEEILRAIAAEDPEDIDRKVTLTRYLAAEKGFDAARGYLQSEIEALPESQRLRFTLGNLYESSDQPERAAEIYRETAAIAPLSEDGLLARNRIVALNIKAEDLDLARAGVGEILADAPDNASALLYRAAFEFVDEDFEAAIADLRVLLRREEGSEAGLLLLARSYVRTGEAVLAQDSYRRLLAVNPKHPNAPGELAALLARQGDTAEAEAVLRARLEVDPEDTAAASGLIQTLLAQQDLDAAEDAARRLVDLNEKNALAQFQLGRVLQAKDSPDEAIAAYRATLAENPRATAALQGLAGVLVQNGRASEALDYLQQFGRDHPEMALEARFLEGGVHGVLGNQAEAREAYEEIVEQAPRAVRAWIALASLERDATETRIQTLERAYAAVPDSAQIGLLLASAYEMNERWDRAIELYEELVPANTSNTIAANNLAALLLDHRDDQESHARALELAERLRDTDQPAFLDTVGWAYYRNGDYPKAVRYLERAVAGAGQVPILRYHLGMAYAANSNTFGARQELSRAIDEAESDFIGIDEARSKLAELGDS